MEISINKKSQKESGSQFLKKPLAIPFNMTVLALLFWYIFKNSRISKNELVKYYGVDKKTMGKWVYFFCEDIVGDIEKYKRKRTLSMWEYFQITTRLGNPYYHPTLSKKEIIEKGEGSYYSLEGCVKRYPKEYGLSENTYLSLNKFPPNVSKKIVDVYA